MGVGVVAARIEESAKGVLHGAGHGAVDVTLHRRQVNDALAKEVIRDHDAFGKDLVEDKHLGFRRVLHPLHIFGLVVVQHRNAVFL